MQTISILQKKSKRFSKILTEYADTTWSGKLFQIKWQTIPDKNNYISKRKLSKVIMNMLLCKFISISSCYRV